MVERSQADPPTAKSQISALSCSPKVVNAGRQITCELWLTKGSVAQVQLASNSSQVRIPAVVTTRPNQSSLTFQAFVEPVARQQSAIVTAILDSSQVQDTVVVMPAARPILTVPGKQNVRFGAPVRFTVSAVDAGDLPVQLTVRGVPAGALSIRRAVAS
jgi:hypothetical protein